MPKQIYLNEKNKNSNVKKLLAYSHWDQNKANSNNRWDYLNI